MFTPHKTNWSNLTTTTPRKMPHTNPRSSSKGKFVDDPAPPRSLLAGEYVAVVDTGDVEDWRRFSEAGLLDEAAMERKDRGVVLEKVAKLEKEV